MKASHLLFSLTLLLFTLPVSAQLALVPYPRQVKELPGASHGLHRLYLGSPTIARVFMKDGARHPAIWLNEVGAGRGARRGVRSDTR